MPGWPSGSSVTHRDLTPVRPDVTANTGRVQRDAQPSGNGTFALSATVQQPGLWVLVLVPVAGLVMTPNGSSVGVTDLRSDARG